MIGTRFTCVGVLSLLVASALVPACGSSDKSRRAGPGEGDAAAGGNDNAGGRIGAGGVVGSGGSTPGAGGSAAGGAPDGGDAGGTGGGDTGGTGGRDAGDGSVGTDAGDAGDGSAPFRGLYVGVSGNDTQPGTRAAPFATVAHAASVAQAGDTIVLLDGSYPTSGAPIVVPDGVDIAADVPGAATITGTGTNTVFSLQGDTRISGLELSTVMRAVQYAAGAAATGTLTVDSTTFQTCAEACLYLEGSVQATVTTAAGQVLATGGNGFVVARGTARVTVNGGELTNFSGIGSASDALFEAWDDSVVELSDVRITRGTARAVMARGTSELLVTNSIFATLAQQLAVLTDTASLTFRGSDLSILPAVATPFECIRVEVQGGVSLSLDDTRVHGCSAGINGGLPAVLSIVGSQLYDHDVAAIDIGASTVAAPATVTFTNSRFYDNGIYGIRMGNNNQPIALTMRGSEVEHGIGTTPNDAFRLGGSPASTFDLGTLASPGGNTFLGDGTTALTGIRFGGAGVTILAVGNTWFPNVQGADASGRYTAPPGQVNEVVGIISGANCVLGNATTIRLAQSP